MFVTLNNETPIAVNRRSGEYMPVRVHDDGTMTPIVLGTGICNIDDFYITTWGEFTKNNVNVAISGLLPTYVCIDNYIPPKDTSQW